MAKATKHQALLAIGLLDVARHVAKAYSANAERKRAESIDLSGTLDGARARLGSARDSANSARMSAWQTILAAGASMRDSHVAELASSTPDRARSAASVARARERQLARSARRRLHESRVPNEVAGRSMPWRMSRTERALDHLPVLGSIVAAVLVAVGAVAYAVRHNHANLEHDELANSTWDASMQDPQAIVQPVPLKDRAHDRLTSAKASSAEVVHRVANASGAAIDAGATKLAEGGSKVAASGAAAAGAGKQAVQDHVVLEARHQLDERVVQPVKRKAITFGVLGFIGLTLWVAIVAVLVQLAVQAIG